MSRTILFVHGTGVRAQALARTLHKLRSEAAQFLPGWKIEACNWGDPFGAALNRQGASVPSYRRSGDASGNRDAQERARWVLVADDPLFELRVAPREQVAGPPPGPRIWKRVLALGAHAKVLPLLTTPELAQEWPKFIAGLAVSTEWEKVLSGLQMSEAAASPAVARAVVAAFQAHLRAALVPTLEAKERGTWWEKLQSPLGGPPAGPVEWLLDRMTAYGRDRRGSLTDLTSPGVGDVLRYQARGETLRAFIEERVKETGATVLLAHSLGGIAAVDWLALDQRNIDALITVGSQAAYFYEIDALFSRVVGSGLPAHFPQRWLNIYDENDFLSYPAAGIFRGRVRDLRVDNHEAFPESHSAYFDNRAEVWPAVADFAQGH